VPLSSPRRRAGKRRPLRIDLTAAIALEFAFSLAIDARKIGAARCHCHSLVK
jgi:hypothetical protein